jgi:hypothetical protein
LSSKAKRCGAREIREELCALDVGRLNAKCQPLVPTRGQSKGVRIKHLSLSVEKHLSTEKPELHGQDFSNMPRGLAGKKEHAFAKHGAEKSQEFVALAASRANAHNSLPVGCSNHMSILAQLGRQQ